MLTCPRVIDPCDVVRTCVYTDPALESMSASDLWQKYLAEVALAEISHGFPAANDPTQNNALDLDIDIVSAETTPVHVYKGCHVAVAVAVAVDAVLLSYAVFYFYLRR